MGKIKSVVLPIACNILLTPKSYCGTLENVRRVKCGDRDVAVLTNTSNNIMRIKVDGDSLFFRECKKHLEIHQYVANEINYYYTQIHPEFVKDRLFVERVLSNKRNFSKFINMGMTNDETSGAFLFCNGKGGSYIGLEGISSSQEERLKDFVQFIWGELFAYKLNSGLKAGEYQIYNAVRSIATYRMAGLLGIQYLIPKTEYVWLHIDDKTPVFGTIMDEAPGICMERMSEESRKKVCTPELQRALNNLNILDIICLEKDHRPGNYNVVLEKEKAVGVVAFDNDSPNSFGIGDISFETYGGCSSWNIKDGVNRPYVDWELADAIMSITDKEIQDVLGDLLNTYQLITLRLRIKKIKKIIATMPKEKLIKRDQWSEDTIKEELSGEYGKTYLVKFLEKQEIAHQPWIKEE